MKSSSYHKQTLQVCQKQQGQNLKLTKIKQNKKPDKHYKKFVKGRSGSS